MLTVQRFICNMLQENCYVISDETKACVICDCGAYTDEERDKITTYIRQNGLNPVHLISTHGHIDHNFGNNTIYDQYGLRPELHMADKKLMDMLDQQASGLMNITLDYPMPAAMYFEADHIIEFGTHKFTVIETPGHSPGSVFFYCKDEDVAFSGDTLFRHAIGRTDFIGGSMFQIIQSLRMICQLPDNTVVYPGHGNETTIGEEIAGNPYLDR